MIDADIEAAVRASGKTPDEWMAAYVQTLTVLADPQRFPALTKFIAAGVFDSADPPEAEFTFGRPMKGHSWHNWTWAGFARTAGAFVKSNTPPGEATDWSY